MKIAFDAKRAFLNNSGLGNYARTLIKSLNDNYPDNEYLPFTTKISDNDFKKYCDANKNISIIEPQHFIDKKLRSRWRSYGITPMLNEQAVNVYHGLSNELPFNIKDFKGKKIVSIHDLIFLKFPKLYPYLDRKIYAKKFRHACDIADEIIAVSEETKKDISELYFIPESKISVIYQSCDEGFYKSYTESEKEAITKKHNLPANYLLYVGTIEERKNLLTIAKALKDVKDIPLVVVGKKKSYYYKVKEFLEKNKMENRVIVLENVSNEELALVYQLASIFIFPSFVEGFGIPIIEALISKTPVITSQGSCFPEAGGPNSIYINPSNSDELAVQINMLLNSSEKRTEIAKKGFEYAKRFHPKVISDQMIVIYNK